MLLHGSSEYHQSQGKFLVQLIAVATKVFVDHKGVYTDDVETLQHDWYPIWAVAQPGYIV